MSKVTDLIPHRPPFLFVDRIVSESETGLIAERAWKGEEDFYKGHYPNAPITPGVLLCESVFPGDTVHIEVQKKEAMGGFTMMSGSIKKIDGTRVLTVNFAVAWKAPEGSEQS